MKFINLPSGRVIDVEKLAYVYVAREKPPGIRYSFGAQYAELDAVDSTAVLDALDALGADTSELRAQAGLADKS